MVKDYPDYTDIMQIIGSDIMIPIDLQAAYIMMPVDLQAQYVTLEIDVVAQTVGNIEVDLAAQSVGNIQVDINAQTIAELKIDIDAQHVGIYLQPDWQVKEGTDKNLSGFATVPDRAATYVLDYTVPANKTLYVCQWGFNVAADIGVWAALQYKHNSDYTTLAANGGQVGGAHSLSKPMAIVAGDHIVVQLRQYGGSDEMGFGSVGGYEI